MGAILLAALLYRATFLPPAALLPRLYATAGFTRQDCRVTDWDMHLRPEEAECADGKGNWAHFDLDSEAFTIPD